MGGTLFGLRPLAAGCRRARCPYEGQNISKGALFIAKAAFPPTPLLRRDACMWGSAPHHPFTAPAVKPETICRWKNSTSKNNGTVAETTAATANITFPSTWVVPKKLAIAGTMV